MSRHLERDELIALIDEVGVGIQREISDDDVTDYGCTLGNDVYDIHCALESLKLLVDEAMTDLSVEE